MRGNNLKSITPGHVHLYEALREQGSTKKIANKGKTKKGRSAMARKAARTGKRG
jgi:hypothetical protein